MSCPTGSSRFCPNPTLACPCYGHAAGTADPLVLGSTPFSGIVCAVASAHYRRRGGPARQPGAIDRHRGHVAICAALLMAEEVPPTDGGSLPEFGRPPVVEVALGVQFRPIFGLRPIELAELRERWRERYPIVQEQPLLPPSIESPAGVPITVPFVIGPSLQTRLWFINRDDTELVQLQHDRVTVNWRQTSADEPYPRYPHVREAFAERFDEVRRFVDEKGLGTIGLTQVEVTYINAIEPEGGQLGRLDWLLKGWRTNDDHHMGAPTQARAALVFDVPDVARPPVRLYVAVDPAQRPDGRPVLFMTLTFRGAPADEGVDEALRLMDQGHEHVVRSFAELTPDEMHSKWERQR